MNLKALMNVRPDPKWVRDILHDLSADHDYAAAIITASMVESYLDDMLAVKITCERKSLLDALYSSGGALSTFANKINVAELFGFITGGMARELTAIKNVRNAFAHAKTQISFETEAVIVAVNNMPIAKSLLDVGRKDRPFTIKEGFVHGASLLTLLMELSKDDLDAVLEEVNSQSQTIPEPR